VMYHAVAHRLVATMMNLDPADLWDGGLQVRIIQAKTMNFKPNWILSYRMVLRTELAQLRRYAELLEPLLSQ
jgi:hypothetical protein